MYRCAVRCRNGIVPLHVHFLCAYTLLPVGPPMRVEHPGSFLRESFLRERAPRHLVQPGYQVCRYGWLRNCAMQDLCLGPWSQLLPWLCKVAGSISEPNPWSSVPS